MADELPPMKLKPVGFVKNGVESVPSGDVDWSGVVSEIEIDPALTEVLDGLEEFSHIVVLFWFHKVTAGEMPLKIRPMGKQELPLIGLFATGTPNRPNRIGRTTVRLLKCQGNILTVEGLDALDGTPVIDIKSYHPRHDSITEARAPRWTVNR